MAQGSPISNTDQNKRKHIFAEILSDIKSYVKKLYPEVHNLDAIVVETPRDSAYGDFSTNAAMVLQKLVGKPPKEISEKLAENLRRNRKYTKVEPISPGFINITLNKREWISVLKEIVKAGAHYGDSIILDHRKINVEFVSANPTGPMHVGHARGAVLGDIISRLLTKCGAEVTKEFYINDAGSQINTLALSTFVRYKQALGMDDIIPEGAYPGDYLIPVGQKLAAKYQDKLITMNEEERVVLIKEFVLNEMVMLIKADLELLNIKHDVFTSEKRDVKDKGVVPETIESLKKKGLIYKGVLEAPKGKPSNDWEPREQELFKATDFGDDVDRALVKSDGSYTYFAADIAYHLNKINRGFNDMVLLLGADHAGYTKRMQAAVKALSDGKATIDVQINNLVNLFKDGTPYKMSKRTGSFVTVKDLVEDIGADAVRFMMLSRKADTAFDLHLEKAVEQTKDNPVFYVQYAHARGCSVLRGAAEQEFSPAATSLDLLNTKDDIELIKILAQLPKVIEAAAFAHEPHKVTYYLIAVADAFHSFWARGNDDVQLRFIIPTNRALTEARLFMVQAILNTLKVGLELVGVTPKERM